MNRKTLYFVSAGMNLLTAVCWVIILIVNKKKADLMDALIVLQGITALLLFITAVINLVKGIRYKGE